MRLGSLTIEAAAEEAAGNWKRFECFCWFREEADRGNWAIIYTHNRDSGLLDQSNAEVIHKALEPFTAGEDPDVVFESHNHWAVGHIDGFSVRVFRGGEPTKAFATYHKLAQRIYDYPVLDESDWSDREVEATEANIPEVAWKLKNELELPAEWAGEVYCWLSNNEPGELESSDDQGGYPCEDSLQRAFAALGYNKELPCK